MKKIRKNRNPRYTEALNLAETNNNLLRENNFQNVLAVSNLESEVTRIKQQLTKLASNVFPRNERLTDAYLKMSGRYSDMVNILRSREDRLDLLERELRNMFPIIGYLQMKQQPMTKIMKTQNLNPYKRSLILRSMSSKTENRTNLKGVLLCSTQVNTEGPQQD